MNKINILDCTLRDGGYVNNWEFGRRNIEKIINKLVLANIEIVECGFLSNKDEYNSEKSIFNKIEQITNILPKEKGNTMFVCMVNYGEYNIEDLPEKGDSDVDGIRVAFHKKDRFEALQFCREVSKKGYKVFVQPMISVNYSDSEFLEIISITNDINPSAFYIVDSFGVIRKKDLMRLFFLVDHNLNSEIMVGYHAHNNIQLAYSNAQSLVDLNTDREIIIDASVFGMGRGAGNLNTELFIEYLNDINYTNYNVYPLLQIIDQVLNKIYKDNYWGYSLPHYISSRYNCHPNYATYLADKNTLTVENLNDIISSLPEERKINFNKEYIEEVYNEYQKHNIDDKKSLDELEYILKDKTVLILAPGSTLSKYKEEIEKESNYDNTIVISVNFIPKDYICDFVFVSNLRRYEEVKDYDLSKLILTSNIKTESKYKVNYMSLLNNEEDVSDNSGLMLIKLLINLGVRNIKVAGLDGYSHDSSKNYFDKDMNISANNIKIDNINKGIAKVINNYRKNNDITIITPTKYSEYI